MSQAAAFFTLHRDLPRQGPGSAAEVHWVLGQVPKPEDVIDVACGPGADTVTLAEALPDAQIEAVDHKPHFVAEARAATARFGPRVTVREGDMRALDGPVDLIWCMGAVYVVGIEVALPLWRAALAPGGHVAFSEPVLLSKTSEVATEFWRDYPGVDDADAITARVAASGYRSLAARVLTGRPWAEYYGPLEARIGQLRAGADAELTEVLDAAEREISLWHQAPDEIAYLLTMAVPE